MATLTNNSSGNFTTAATWSVCDTTSLNLADTTRTATTTTSFVSSAAFTPGAITTDGVGLYFSTRVGSGTISVRLAIGGVAVVGTTVTINATDIPATIRGWVFFKFTAPVTLIAATAYTVQVTGTSAGHVIYRGASTTTDWARYLRTTTTQAPAAADTLLVCGEYISAGVSNSLTVTVNNTAATVFGSIFINAKGILQSGIAASTAYQLITNFDLNITGDGTLQLGTSANPVPASSTFLLQINQTGVAVNKGIIVLSTGKFATFGNAITSRAYLAADVAAAATSIISNVTTGWKAGDQIVLASTTQTITQQELRTLAVDSSGTTITVPALTNAHSGTSPTIGEIANITRNVKVASDSASFSTYILTAAESTIDFNNTEFYWMGSATANKRGISSIITTGYFTAKGCSFRDFTAASAAALYFNLTNNNANITVDDCVFYNTTASLVTGSLSSPTNSITNCWFFAAPINTIAMIGGTFSNIMSTGSALGIFITTSDNQGLTISNIVAHSNGSGIQFNAASYAKVNASNIIAWRNTARGLYLNTATAAFIDTVTCFGNGTTGVDIQSCIEVDLINLTLDAGVTQLQPVGVTLSASNIQVTISNSTFGATTTHSTGDVSIATANTYHDVYFNNCLFGSTTEMANQARLMLNSSVGSSKHDKTNGTHKSWKRNGTVTYDTVLSRSSPSSQRLTPNIATSRLATQDRKFSIPAGKTANVSVAVRRSVAGDGSAYNGNLPRLWLRSNTIAGITIDTLLATATAASSGAFETITGVIPAATVDTINTIFLDCDGTVGWINIDQWKLDIVDGSANTMANLETYWNDGTPFQSVNTGLINGPGAETYWKDGTPATDLFQINSIQTGKFFLIFDE